MQKGIGVVCVVIGVVFIVIDHDVTNSVVSQMKKVFTGAPLDEAMKL
jgi:hypothetical protein